MLRSKSRLARIIHKWINPRGNGPGAGEMSGVTDQVVAEFLWLVLSILSLRISIASVLPDHSLAQYQESASNSVQLQTNVDLRILTKTSKKKSPMSHNASSVVPKYSYSYVF